MKLFLRYILTLAWCLSCSVSALASDMLEGGQVLVSLEELQSGNLDIRGEAFFYHNHLYDLNEIQQDTTSCCFSLIGHSWNSNTLVDYPRFKAQGYGTYYFKIIIPQESVGETFMLRSPDFISSASNIVVNGNTCGGNGTVGTSCYDSSYKPSHYFKAYSFVADTCVLDVVIQCANYHNTKGGIVRPLSFGLTEHVVHARQCSIIFDIFIIVSLLIMFLYHFTAYIVSQDRVKLLYYSLLCLVIAIDLMFSGSVSFFIFFTNSPFSFYSPLHLNIPYFIPAFAVLFIYALFPSRISKVLVLMCFISALVCSIITFYGESHWYAYIRRYHFFSLSLLILSGLLFAVKLIKKKEFAARFFFYFYLFLTLCFFHDLLDMVELISSKHIFSLGILIFVILLAILSGKRSAHQHSEFVLATSALEQKKSELEEKVKVRNEEIQKSLEDLNQLHSFQESVTKVIAHDLKSSLKPLINVEDIDPASYPELRNIGYRMLTTVHNMLDIYRYNNNRVVVQNNKFKLRKPVEAILSDLSFIVKKKTLSVEVLYADDYELNADIEIFKKVFCNLLLTSCRYSPEGGSIKIHFKVCDNDKLRVTISNQGLPLSDLQKEKIFSTNFILDDITTLEGKKTLLSLHFCKLAIEAQNGSVGVDFNDTVGATFWFSLSGVTIIPKEEEEVADNLVITYEDRVYLTPFVHQLLHLEIFDCSKIATLLTQISPKNDNISHWCDSVSSACYQLDNDSYKSLLDMVVSKENKEFNIPYECKTCCI